MRRRTWKKNLKTMSAFIPASEYVSDTVVLVLRIERRKIGVNAAAVFEAMESRATKIYIPALVLAEILYLSENEESQHHSQA